MQFVLFVSVFPSSYHGTFFYICLANQSAVSKPHPTEGAEICTGCGIPHCYKVRRTVYASLCTGRCARYLCCSLFFCCLDVSFPNAHVIFSEKWTTRTSTSIFYVPPTIVRSSPRKNPGRERLAVLYRVTAFVAFGGRCLCSACCIARSFASFGYQHHNTTITPPAFFCCHVEQSIGYSPRGS